jgi:hypothetical protein
MYEEGPDEKCPNSGSTGYVWCKELGECITPWETACPLEGEPFQGPTTLECTDDMRCSFSEGCLLYMNGNTLGGLYVTGLNGTFEMDANCTGNCTGCLEANSGSRDRHLRGIN